jgi:hypothetical protein
MPCNYMPINFNLLALVCLLWIITARFQEVICANDDLYFILPFGKMFICYRLLIVKKLKCTIPEMVITNTPLYRI